MSPAYSDDLPESYYTDNPDDNVMHLGNVTVHGYVRQAYSDGSIYGSDYSSLAARMAYSRELPTRDFVNFAWKFMPRYSSLPDPADLGEGEKGYYTAGQYAFYKNGSLLVPQGSYPLQIPLGDPGVNPQSGFISVYAVMHATRPQFSLRARDATGATNVLWLGDQRGFL